MRRRRRPSYTPTTPWAPPTGPRETRRHDFGTWDAYMAYLRGIGEYGGKSELTDPAWAGVSSNAEALALAARGWPEGMARVEPMLAPMLTALTPMIAAGSVWTQDVHGASWDAGEYLSGNPECWLRQEPVTIKPTVTLQLLGTVASGVSTDALIRRGAATVALALALERAGYAVRIERVDGGAFNTVARTQWVRVPLTDDLGGPMDIDRVLFACAHLAGLRNIGFRVLMHVGGVTNTTAEYIPLPDETTNPYPATLRIPGMRIRHDGPSTDWNNPAAVTAWLTETFATLTQGA